MNIQFLVSELGKETMILGLPWLKKEYNLSLTGIKEWLTSTHKLLTKFKDIIWRSFKLTRMEVLIFSSKPTMEEIFDDIEHPPKNEPLSFDEPILEQIDNDNEEFNDKDEVRLLWAYFGKDNKEDTYPEL